MYINEYESKKTNKKNKYKILSIIILQLSFVSLGVLAGSWYIVNNRLVQLNNGDLDIIVAKNVAIAFSAIFAISIVFLGIFFALYKSNKNFNFVIDGIKINAKKFESVFIRKSTKNAIASEEIQEAPKGEITPATIMTTANNNKELLIDSPKTSSSMNSLAISSNGGNYKNTKKENNYKSNKSNSYNLDSKNTSKINAFEPSVKTVKSSSKDEESVVASRVKSKPKSTKTTSSKGIA